MAEEEYSDEIGEEQLDALINRANSAEAKNIELTRALGGMGQENKDKNFLHLQISTKDMLEKLEHFYRGDIPKEDENGNIDWSEQTNKELVTFNEFGVSSLMEHVTKYINQNTILSLYSSERIYEIMADIGEDLTLFLQCNYQQMGMDTYFKKTKFRMIISTTLHIIESTYRRAIMGRTLEEVNQSKVVSQFGSMPQPALPQQKSRFWNRIFPNR